MDTLDNPHTYDNDFLPNGKYKWDSQKYAAKITAVATVISKIGDSDGPELIGLAEVETKKELLNLVASKELKSSHYSIVHYDSPDQRGIDVALLYKSNCFKVISSRIYSASFLTIKSHTRDVLLVKGIMEKDTLFVLVNHWPSRRKGKEQSENKRIAVAIMVREITDSILQVSVNAKIMVMGDFNDDPSDNSLFIELNAKPELSTLKNGEFYNPFYLLNKQGHGTLLYNQKWYMFDQILLSKNFFEKKTFYPFKEAMVYDPDWLYYKKEKQKGPYRTFMGKNYTGGYSDHFPVCIVFRK
jgi:hypothetical protein